MRSRRWHGDRARLPVRLLLRLLLLPMLMLLLLLGWKWLVMLAACEEGNVRPCSMVKCARRLLICLVDQRTLLLLSLRLLVCRVINMIISVRIRQRRGCTGLLERVNPSRQPENAPGKQ